MEAIVEKRRKLSSVAMKKQSRTIIKSKPKIRIIHIFAPEIIKTDVSNFRELVQRLTGKPDHTLNKTNPKQSAESDDRFCLNSDEDDQEEMMSMTWNGNNGGDEISSGGFLTGFGDFDGFIQDLGEFPFLPFTTSIDPLPSSSHLRGGVYSESHQFL